MRSTSVESVLMVSRGRTRRNTMVKFVSLSTGSIVTDSVDTENSSGLVAVKVQAASFFDPELCKFSVKNKLCTKSVCTFIHLKGTRRQTNNSAFGHKKGKAENKKSDPSKGVTKANQDQDFLELRRLLETMQTRIELLSEKVDQRSSLPQTQMPYHYPRPPSASPLQSGTVLPPYHYHYPQFLPPQRTHVPIIPHASS